MNRDFNEDLKEDTYDDKFEYPGCVKIDISELEN